MSFNLVFDNLRKMREDAEYVIRFIQQRAEADKPEMPSPSGPVPSSPVGSGKLTYRVYMDDSKFISEKVRLIGKAITELRYLLLGKKEFLTKADLMNYQPFQEPVEKARETFTKAYDRINSVVQGQPDYGSFYLHMTDLQQDIMNLERKVLEVEALTLDAPSVEESYVKREVESTLAKMEDTRTRIRQKIFLRADPDGKKLLHKIMNSVDEELDRAVGHLMYLAGFDYEIYRNLKGNLDILAYHVDEKTGILIETTAKKPEKSKVDQVAVRKAEYVKYFEEMLGPNPWIYPLLVSTNEEPKLHDEARADARDNGVSIFTRKQIEELVNLMKKGKLNRKKVVDMILKNIPT